MCWKEARGTPNFWRWFNTTQFSYQCFHLIHAKVFFNPHFSQIESRFCTSLLLILLLLINYYAAELFDLEEEDYQPNGKTYVKSISSSSIGNLRKYYYLL